MTADEGEWKTAKPQWKINIAEIIFSVHWARRESLLAEIKSIIGFFLLSEFDIKANSESSRKANLGIINKFTEPENKQRQNLFFLFETFSLISVAGRLSRLYFQFF